MIKAFKKNKTVSKAHNGLITFDKVVSYEDRGSASRVMRLITKANKYRRRNRRSLKLYSKVWNNRRMVIRK